MGLRVPANFLGRFVKMHSGPGVKFDILFASGAAIRNEWSYTFNRVYIFMLGGRKKVRLFDSWFIQYSILV
jgi:hypothetical protein